MCYPVTILLINTVINNSYHLGMSVQVELFIGLVKLTLAHHSLVAISIGMASEHQKYCMAGNFQGR